MAHLGEYEVDPAHYLNNGSVVQVHDDATEVDGDCEALVYRLMVRGRITDPRNVRNPE